MTENDREFFYFKCWMALKSKMHGFNDLMRDIELEVGNFPMCSPPTAELDGSEPATIQKTEDEEEVM